MSYVTLDRIVEEQARGEGAIRRQVEQSGRPLRSHAATMSDDELLARLRGLCLVTLWERWWPDKPCMEFLDDKIQAGYEAEERGDTAGAARIWLGPGPTR